MTAHRSHPTIVVAGAAAAAVLLAAAGCGGSSAKHPATHGASVPAGTAAASRGSSDAASAGNSTTRSTGDGGVRKDASISVRVAGPRRSAPGRVTFAPPGGESRTAFSTRADGICQSFRARARKIGSGATTLAAQETVLPHLVTATEQAVKALTELSPPTGQAAGLRRFATLTVASVVAFAEAQTRTGSTSEAVGSQVEARDLADSARSSSDAAAASAAARRLELHVCGSPGSAWL